MLQARDPRIKTAVLLLAVVTAVVITTIPALLVLYAACVALAALSKINLFYFLKRTWIFIPLFSLAIALPSIFSIVTPGTELAAAQIAGYRLAVTREGVAGAALFVTRVATSVSLVILLTLTTRQNELLKVLRMFGIPQLFIMTLGMCYRYIFIFSETVMQTHTAMKSRAGRAVPARQGRRIVGWHIAHLWMRAYYLSGQVYNAMLSRGYCGEPVTLQAFKTSAGDWVFLAAALGAMSAAVWVNGWKGIA